MLTWLLGRSSHERRKRADASHVQKLRAQGARIGEGCRIYSDYFSTEPYLVSLGDGVSVAGGAKFLIHEGTARMLRARRPAIQNFGRIVVGDDTFIGENAIILAGTTIGKRCIVGAGAVVRGTIPDDSLVIGNPAKIVGRASILLERLYVSPNTVDTFDLTPAERRAFLNAHFGLGPEGDGRAE